MLLYQNLAFTIHEKIWKKLFKDKKFEILAPTWNEEFELPDGQYSVSDIQDCFEYMFKKQGEKTDHPSKNVHK